MLQVQSIFNTLTGLIVPVLALIYLIQFGYKDKLYTVSFSILCLPLIGYLVSIFGIKPMAELWGFYLLFGNGIVIIILVLKANKEEFKKLLKIPIFVAVLIYFLFIGFTILHLPGANEIKIISILFLIISLYPIFKHPNHKVIKLYQLIIIEWFILLMNSFL